MPIINEEELSAYRKLKEAEKKKITPSLSQPEEVWRRRGDIRRDPSQYAIAPKGISSLGEAGTETDKRFAGQLPWTRRAPAQPISDIPPTTPTPVKTAIGGIVEPLPETAIKPPVSAVTPTTPTGAGMPKTVIPPMPKRPDVDIPESPSLTARAYIPPDEKPLDTSSAVSKGLLTAGLTMLAQKPSKYPISFGQSLGEGGLAGLGAFGEEMKDVRATADRKQDRAERTALSNIENLSRVDATLFTQKANEKAAAELRAGRLDEAEYEAGTRARESALKLQAEAPKTQAEIEKLKAETTKVGADKTSQEKYVLETQAAKAALAGSRDPFTGEIDEDAYNRIYDLSLSKLQGKGTPTAESWRQYNQ